MLRDLATPPAAPAAVDALAAGERPRRTQCAGPRRQAEAAPTHGADRGPGAEGAARPVRVAASATALVVVVAAAAVVVAAAAVVVVVVAAAAVVVHC